MIKRILVVLVLLVLLVLTVPPLRERAQPAIDRFNALVGWTVEGPLSPAVNPYRELEAQSTLQKVMRELVQDRNSGYVRPDEDEFQDYMARKLPGESVTDPWGTPYEYNPGSGRGDFEIITLGADGASGGQGPAEDLSSKTINQAAE